MSKTTKEKHKLKRSRPVTVDASEFEKILTSIVTGKFGELDLSYNTHKSYYKNADAAINGYSPEYQGDWFSEDERQKAIDEDSVWTIYWNPRTPCGSCTVHASSLSAILTYLLDGDLS